MLCKDLDRQNRNSLNNREINNEDFTGSRRSDGVISTQDYIRRAMEGMLKFYEDFNRSAWLCHRISKYCVQVYVVASEKHFLASGCRPGVMDIDEFGVKFMMMWRLEANKCFLEATANTPYVEVVKMVWFEVLRSTPSRNASVVTRLLGLWFLSSRVHIMALEI